MKDTQKKILETCCLLLAKHGYSSFSYGLVAEHMQVSKGLVAYHFPQKSVIFQRLIEDYFAEIADHLTQVIHTDESATAILNAYILGTLQYVQEHKIQTLAIMEVISNERSDNGELIYHSSTGIKEPIIEILRYGQESNEFLCCDNDIMAKLIRSLIDTCSYEIAHNRCENEEYFISQTIQYIQHMVEEK